MSCSTCRTGTIRPRSGRNGWPVDWHVIRVLFRVRVDEPTDAIVTEDAGGSTAAARWFTVAEALGLPLTEVARSAVQRLTVEKVG